MIQELLKDKKKIGIGIVLFIVVIISGITYVKSGYKELKKNDTESIFVDNSDENEQLNENKSKYKNTSKKANGDISNKGISIPAKENTIIVEIKGEVKKPDVYTLNESAIVKELIEAAGGLTENAELSNINRAKKLQNHELIYIANKNDVNKEVSNESSGIKSSDNKVQGGNNKRININTGTLEELKTLNGVGDSKAKSIIEYREQNGGFKSIEDIKNVTGIGEKMFERIKNQIEC
ncbi:helix-hairpin-helix domain-containing protein [Clostridium sp. C2-6-12]|uniref:helix-hairpin-helix domain-containing protein n=1 Tax=Clostridium sp. C2-6-12 TaxID=2698832 RepID=UPI00136CE030|nr:helix-hairpin-helix domain-containing protein [Clostridium sp. C2-6-12]